MIIENQLTHLKFFITTITFAKVLISKYLITLYI